jgi:hypothetical protein
VVHAAVARAGWDRGAAAGYWGALVAARRRVHAEYAAVAAVLGAEFARQHPVEEWLACWAMVRSRSFLLQFLMVGASSSVGGPPGRLKRPWHI